MRGAANARCEVSLRAVAKDLSSDSAMDRGLSRLARVRKGVSSAERAERPVRGAHVEPDGDEAPDEGDDAAVALGTKGATLLLYAPEIDEAMDAAPVLAELAADTSPNVDMLEAVEVALDDLPVSIRVALEAVGDASLDALLAAGRLAQARNITPDGERLAMFIFLASRVVADDGTATNATGSMPLPTDLGDAA